MNENLILTDNCNLSCTYCRGKIYGADRCNETLAFQATKHRLPI